MLQPKRIFVAGHKGLAGSAIVRALEKSGDAEIIVRDRKSLDLTNQAEVRRFFEKEDIDQVYLAAARVGGIWANNTYPAEFIYQNLMIECNVITVQSCLLISTGRAIISIWRMRMYCQR